jgi:hypothetical protein
MPDIYQVTLPDGRLTRIVAEQDYIDEHFPGAQKEAPPEAAVPPAPDALPAARLVTRLAFRNRFTGAEKVAIEFASLDNPDAPAAQRQQAAALRVYQRDVESATFIDLDNVDTRAGVQMLEAAGLLAAGRAAEILDAPVAPGQAWQA